MTAALITYALALPALCYVVGGVLGFNDLELAEQASPAARDVLAERQRQIDVEGWTPKHDDHNDRGELSLAAANYSFATGLSLKHETRPDDRQPRMSWPWDAYWWKPSPDPRRNLVKAGALILAEIERLDRAAIAAEKLAGE